jgi:hypothetical protein
VNLIERREAYRAVKERFHLRAAQRDWLDAYPLLVELLEAAHVGDWKTVTDMLTENGVLDAIQL